MRALSISLAATLALLAAPAFAQTLTVGVQTTFGIDPHFALLGPNMAASRHIFDTLVNRDADSRWTPGLTARWTPVADPCGNSRCAPA